MARHFLRLRRGDNGPVFFRLLSAAGTPLDLSGSVIVWRVTAGGLEVLRAATPSERLDLIEPALGLVAWRPTLADTRALPLGQEATGEIERRIGGEQTSLATFTLSVTEGANDDAG